MIRQNINVTLINTMKIHFIIYWQHIMNTSCWVINDPRPAPIHIIPRSDVVVWIFIIFCVRIEDCSSFFNFHHFSTFLGYVHLILRNSDEIPQSSITKECKRKVEQTRSKYTHYSLQNIWFQFCLFFMKTRRNSLITDVNYTLNHFLKL